MTTELAPDHAVRATQTCSVRGNTTSTRHLASETQACRARGPAGGERRINLLDPALALAAEVLDDLERTRIANENRLRQLTRATADTDGHERGFGLTDDHPDVRQLRLIVESIHALEHQAELNLGRHLRRHPLGPWMRRTIGIGSKQGARLLAALGDPYWSSLHNRPRTVSELWAYCGYHVLPASQTMRDAHAFVAPGDQIHDVDQDLVDHQKVGVGIAKGGDAGYGTPDTQLTSAGVAPRRVRGQRANWSAMAKMRAYLIAESCMKNRRSPYRAEYDKARAHHADATHQVACPRCGPAGRPALPESPLSDGHMHARALRKVAKEILKDLWREAKRLHETTESE